MASPLADYQNSIYLGGLTGNLPEFPIGVRALERKAEEVLDPGPHGYLAGGAGTEDTMRENLEAFRRHRIVPRALRDVEVRDLSTTVLETPMPAPVMLAPVGVQSILHDDGELATARAARATGTPYILSTAASYSMEEVAAAGDGVPWWFQLYWPKDDALTGSLIARAEAAGAQALVVTIDTRMLAWRPRDLDQSYLPFLNGIGLANYFTDPVFRGALEKPPEEDLMAAVGHWIGLFSDPSLDWDDLSALRARTELPILVKGVLHPEDAREAERRGAEGVIVSNHGGRQVDGSIAALDALAPIVDAVPEATVLFDSGVRCGADVLKAVALGADAVLVGRPAMWGLAVGGAAGVEQVLRCLGAELDLTLALSGHSSLSTVNRDIFAW